MYKRVVFPERGGRRRRWIGVCCLKKSSRAELLSTSAPILAKKVKLDVVGLTSWFDSETKMDGYRMK